MMNWRGCRRKWSWHILKRNCCSICLEGLEEVLENHIQDTSSDMKPGLSEDN
jgi:hypothetical protein